MAAPEDLIRRHLAPFGVPLTPEVLAAIGNYLDKLLLWNRRMNLTSLTRPEEVLERHFGESLIAASAIQRTNGWLVDIGSGAGFPGLPLKLVHPDLKLTLVESSSKKCAFLNEIIRQLKLSGVEVRNNRLEHIAPSHLGVDYVSARALGQLPKLLSWSSAALRVGGAVLLWVGWKEAKELRSMAGWDWQVPLKIPLSRQRYLLVGHSRLLCST